MSEIVETTESELDHYRSWVGKQTILHDNVSSDVIARFAAAIDRPMPDDGLVPAMWHYGLFLNDVPSAQLGPDGHPPRGGFMPPVRLPRRMFAGSEAHFVSPLRIGVPASCRSEIVSVDLRQSGRGDLILVRVLDEISQHGSLCIKETRTIVYLNAGAAVPPVVADSSRPMRADDETWQPDSVALFRFSAVTFNAHRIHYDRPYAREVELYPDLVVHGPYTAIRLCDFASRCKNSRLRTFSFRGEAPLFCGQPVTLAAIEDGPSLRVAAIRCDGKTAMSAGAVT